MQLTLSTIILALAAVTTALPTTLDTRTPTRGGGRGPSTFKGITMKSNCGKCLAADPSKAANGVNPVQLQDCNSSDGQKWDMITRGRRGRGDALIVNSQTNECLNFDPSRPAGQQVMMVACGAGKFADAAGASQKRFPLVGNQVTIEPVTGQNACVTVMDQATLDQKACDEKDATQLFTIGN